MKKLTFNIFINAPVEKVWNTMFEKDTYEKWTTEFSEGSTFIGSWEEGASIRFVGPDGNDGMEAVIAENRLHEFVSIKHLAMLENGEQTHLEMFPAFENYTFISKDGGTEVLIEQDMAPEYEEMFQEMWPKALESLKVLSEGQSLMEKKSPVA